MRKKSTNLNFGAGVPLEGWINLDASPLFFFPRIFHRVLHLLNLVKRSKFFLNSHYRYFVLNKENKLPLEDNSINVIYCSHVLEHLHNENIQFLLDEFYRILKPNGVVRILVPDLENTFYQILKQDESSVDIGKKLGTLPIVLKHSRIVSALEGLAGFPSIHKTMFLKNNLHKIEGQNWKLAGNLSYLKSNINPDILKSIENIDRCTDALIFELIKK